MTDFDFHFGHNDILLEELEEIVKDGSKKRKKIENNCKKKIASLFGEYFNISIINSILKKNGFKGIYVLEDSLYECLFLGGCAQYMCAGEKAIFISETDSKRQEVLCHELILALIDNRIKPLYGEPKLDPIYDSIEEGIASYIANLSTGKELKPTSSYYPLAKLIEQLNQLYRCNKERKYPNFLLHAILEPEDVIFQIKEIYSSIISKKMEENKETESTAYKTAYNLFVTASHCLENESRDSYYLMSYMNFLYYAFNNEILMLNECPDKIQETFELNQLKKHEVESEIIKKLVYGDKYYLNIFESINGLNEAIPNCIEKQQIEGKQKRR